MLCRYLLVISIQPSLKAELLGQVVQSSIKLHVTQDKQEFWFEFCIFAGKFSVYIIWPSVLSLNDLKLTKTKAVKNICTQEKFILWLTFKLIPG